MESTPVPHVPVGVPPSGSSAELTSRYKDGTRGRAIALRRFAPSTALRTCAVAPQASTWSLRAFAASRLATLLAFAASLLLLPSAAAQKKLQVLTTFLPAYCVAANVAGEAAHVQNLVPGSTSPHDYPLTPSDMRKIQSADLIVLNGLGLESWLAKAFAAGKRPQSKLVELSAGLKQELIHSGDGHDHSHDHDHGHDHSDINPHIWLDPLLLMRGVSNVLEAFKAADPANTATYTANAADYIARLQKLHLELDQQLAPVRATPFVTYHNAFPYFARRYNLQVAGVVQEVADVSPSPREVARLSREMREKKVAAIFTEPQGGGRLAKRLAQDLKLATGELDTLEAGPLRPSAYEEGMRKNARTLTQVLGSNEK